MAGEELNAVLNEVVRLNPGAAGPPLYGAAPKPYSHQDYPKWVDGPNGRVLVQDMAEEQVLLPKTPTPTKA